MTGPVNPVETQVPWPHLFDAISLPIAVLDRRGEILRCNEAMAQFLNEPAMALHRQFIGDVVGSRLTQPTDPTDWGPSDLWLSGPDRPHRVMTFCLGGRPVRILADGLFNEHGVAMGTVLSFQQLEAQGVPVPDTLPAAIRSATAEVPRVAIDSEERHIDEDALGSEEEPSAILSQRHPEAFAELVAQYKYLMSLVLEERVFKVDHHIHEELRTMASRLGELEAGPRDVVDVHATALRIKMRASSMSRAKVLTIEGRLIVLELMGHLVSYYRNSSRHGG